MEFNFNSIDSRIAANEKRLEYENNRYQQIQSKVAYLTIIYSILSIYLVQLFEFTFCDGIPYRSAFIAIAGLYLLLALFSVIFAIRLLIPQSVAYTHLPKYFFDEIMGKYQKAGITEEDELDMYVKITYSMELEEAVESNYNLSNRKSFLYNRAFRFGLLAMLPYVFSVAFYFTYHKEQKPAMDLNNYRDILNYQDSLHSANLK